MLRFITATKSVFHVFVKGAQRVRLENDRCSAGTAKPQSSHCSGGQSKARKMLDSLSFPAVYGKAALLASGLYMARSVSDIGFEDRP